MMKIAYCIDSITAWGGIERVTLSKANALAEIDGNIIYFFVVTNKGIPVFPVNSKIQIINLDVDYDAAKGLARLKSEIVFRRKKYEHKVKLIGKLNSIQPDIVVSTGQAEKHFIRSLQLNYNPVLIKEIHFSSDFRLIEASSFKERVYANIAQFLDNHWNIRKFDRVVVLTEEDIQKNWRKYKNVVVIPNPLTKNCNIESSNVSSNKVIAAGRLVRQKNFDSLINAWSYVFEKHPDWKLEIYGDGYLKDFLSKQINILKLNSSIFLKGLSNDIFEKMSHSSIFVLSSIYEGFGLVIVEAMSCGLPVVSYACPCGPKDIIEEGKDGFLVEVNDEQTLAARINQLIEDEELRRQMSKAALLKSEKYKMERIIPMWMDLFEKLKREKG